MIRFLLIVLAAVAANFGPSAPGIEPTRHTWTIEGVEREALVAVPESATTTPAPVVFAFHGHGGNMRNSARTFRMHTLWPAAITVYMQGLNTPGQLTDPEGKKAGWQKSKGDQEDRDLKFFEVVLTTLQSDYHVDTTRIYSMGHSNGGGFTYLLWSEFPETFAAVAPSGSAATRVKDKLKPLPVFHVAGENDPLVRYAWQKATIEFVRILNECGEGTPWESDCTLYPSRLNAPVVTLITSQGHKYPPEANALIVKFFKQHSRKPALNTPPSSAGP